MQRCSQLMQVVCLTNATTAYLSTAGKLPFISVTINILFYLALHHKVVTNIPLVHLNISFQVQKKLKENGVPKASKMGLEPCDCKLILCSYKENKKL